MSKKQRAKQANLQSDNIEIENWMPSDGITMMGTGTVDSLDPDMGGLTYSYSDVGDLGTLDMFEEQLRKKYPALKDAYEHYQNIKKMCEQREQEENED